MSKGVSVQPYRPAVRTPLAGTLGRVAVALRRPLQPAVSDVRPDRTATGDAPRVLLLTSTLGSGHVRAAQAVEAALRRRAPQAEVGTLDFWSLADRQVVYGARQAYLRLVQTRPELYDRIYQLDQRTWRQIVERNQPPPPDFAEVLALVPGAHERRAQRVRQGSTFRFDRIVFPLLRAALAGHPQRMPPINRLARLASMTWAWTRLTARLGASVRAFAPDAIVITQMNLAALLSSVKRHRGLDIPTLAIVTDFGLHDFWLQPSIDRYCLAHEQVIGLAGASLDPARVLISGIPLMPGFSQPPSMQQARLELGLDPDAPTVLVLGGGLGLGVDSAAQRLLASTDRLQVVVTAGRNGTARTALAPLAAHYGARLRILSWTDRMQTVMRAADIVVGKPGGLTVAEVLACGRPLVATRSLGGQEGFNVRFLEAHGVGRLVPEDALVRTIESALADRAELAHVQERAMQLGQRDGASQVAALALELAQTHRARRRPA